MTCLTPLLRMTCCSLPLLLATPLSAEDRCPAGPGGPHDVDKFGRMLGGTENGGHPWEGEMTIRVDDRDSPLTAMFEGELFTVRDQAFQLQEPTLRDRLRVLLRIDVDRMPPPRRPFFATRVEDRDFPMSWIKTHGKDRVFFSAFGHSDFTFWNPKMLEHFLAGIQYALGDLRADDRPSVQAAR